MPTGPEWQICWSWRCSSLVSNSNDVLFVCRKLMKDLIVTGMNLIVCQFLLMNLCDEQDSKQCPILKLLLTVFGENFVYLSINEGNIIRHGFLCECSSLHSYPICNYNSFYNYPHWKLVTFETEVLNSTKLLHKNRERQWEQAWFLTDCVTGSFIFIGNPKMFGNGLQCQNYTDCNGIWSAYGKVDSKALEGWRIAWTDSLLGQETSSQDTTPDVLLLHTPVFVRHW